VATRDEVVDGLLVLAARAGDVEAFEHLASRWHPRLLRHARRLTGDADGARDATQDAWVAVVRGLGRLRDPALFGAWALRITGRRCVEWVASRRRARARNTGAGSIPAAPSDEPAADDLARVREALRCMSDDDRLLLAMFYVEGYTVAEIAHACEVPPGTVKSRLFHARGRLRAVLEVSDDAETRC
jgi:RNA polymerase sigma factor (sigma-70 family)